MSLRLLGGGEDFPGGVDLSNGTAAAPSLRFISDPTSGIYLSGGVAISYLGVRRALFRNTDITLDTGELVLNNGGDFYVTKPGTSSFHFRTNGGAGGVQFEIANDGAIKALLALHVAGTKVVGAQGASVADPSGGATIDSQARTAIIAVISRLEAHGLIATV